MMERQASPCTSTAAGNQPSSALLHIDGAIAAVCSDLGMPPTVANALFIISRVPGIAAQAQEEMNREHPMRQIDPKDYIYDGPLERRLPERRK